jgi:hypothetical protein
MAKTMLNQTMSRPILYAYAQEMIAKTPSKWLTRKMEKIEEFKECIPAIKEMVKNKISNLYPKEHLEILKIYEQTNQESCFWFTDREKEAEDRNHRNDERSIYANFDCKGYGGSYRYGSSDSKEIGNLSIKDTIALYFEDMVKDGVDVMKYLFMEANDRKDYNGKRCSWSEQSALEKSIKSYGTKFFEDNDMSMEFTMPNSNYSCYQRAHLVTSKEYKVLCSWGDKLEDIQLQWHKHYEEMKEKFKHYAQLIRGSRTLEAVIEDWSEAENVRHKISGTGTAVALCTVGKSIIQQDMLARQAKDKVAFVVTPTESAWGSA